MTHFFRVMDIILSDRQWQTNLWTASAGTVTGEDMKLHFGCGGNVLESWQNYDMDIDIRKPLPFEANSAKRIFTEHMIEHVTHREAYRFLEECYRILEPQGVIRLSFPSAERIWNYRHMQISQDYSKWLAGCGVGDGSDKAKITSILFNHGHQALWSSSLMICVLSSIGFICYQSSVGCSAYEDLCNIEGHGKAIGKEFNLLETEVMEGVKR